MSCFYVAIKHYKFWAANYIYYKHTQECLPELLLFSRDKDPSMQLRWEVCLNWDYVVPLLCIWIHARRYWREMRNKTEVNPKLMTLGRLPAHIVNEISKYH